MIVDLVLLGQVLELRARGTHECRDQKLLAWRQPPLAGSGRRDG